MNRHSLHDASPAQLDAEALTRQLRGHWHGSDGMACCPAHDDRNPSLSISDGDNGKLLVHCHAGCDQVAVIDALKSRGLWTSGGDHRGNSGNAPAKPSDNWHAILPVPPEKRTLQLWMATDQWIYLSETGEWLFAVHRYDEEGKKRFYPWSYGILNGKKGWHCRYPASPRPLYGLDRLAAKPDAEVLLVEGEKSADAAQALFPELSVLSWPGGAGGVRHVDLTPLRSRRCWLWPDNDDAGRTAMAELADRLLATGAEVLAIIEPPENTSRGWDLADARSEDWDVADLAARFIESRPTKTASVNSCSAALDDASDSPASANSPETERRSPNRNNAPVDRPVAGASAPEAILATTDADTRAKRNDPPPPPDGAAVGSGPDTWPVMCLGQSKGHYYFLSPSGELRSFTFDKLTRRGLVSLFDGDTSWLEKQFPKGGNIIGWQAGEAAEALIKACAKAGFFDQRCIRGVGTWPVSGNRFLVHCGDQILAPPDLVTGGSPASHPAGFVWVPAGRVIDGCAYPALPKQPKPHESTATDEEVRELRSFLETWGFTAQAGPRLVLGWVACALVAGCLPWRPHLWISGGSGSGKTTLLHLLKGLLGSRALSYSAPTEYAVRESLGASAQPVILDEIESSPEDRTKIRAIVNLSKLASSDDQSPIAKGGGDGQVKHWSVRGLFLFSSINPVDLNPQDRNRITIISLQGHRSSADSRQLLSNLQTFAKLGPRLHARLLDRLPVFRERLEIFRHALAGHDMTSREADQFGTLLAMADLLEPDAATDESTVEERVQEVLNSDFSPIPEDADHEECLTHILTSQIRVEDTLGTRTRSVEQVLTDLDLQSLDSERDKLSVLRASGMTVRALPEADGELCLIVANKHSGLARLFVGTRWERELWASTLGRHPRMLKLEKTQKFRGQAARGQAIRLRDLDLDWSPDNQEYLDSKLGS